MEPQSSELSRQASFSPGLRVLVDARKILDGGIGVYTNNLINGLLDRDTRVSVIGDPKKVEEMPWASSVECLAEVARSYSFEELFGLSRRIDFSQYDIFHTPHYILPYGIAIPTVVTIHDLIHIHFPEKVYYPWIASALIRSSLKRASRVLTVSQATFQDLHRFVGGRQDLMQKISVVPNALDPFFLESQPSGDFVRSRFGVSGSYFLAVASMLKPHKGVRDLFEAFQAFQKRRVAEDLPDVKLVLVGKGTETIVEVERLLNKVGGIKGVHLLGSVSREELFQLYGSAEALVVPSKAEGFCLPVIEAQAVGTPVVCRPVPAIQELLGNRDVVAADFSIQSFVESLLSLWQRRQRGDLSSRPDLEARRKQMLRYDRGGIADVCLQVYQDAWLGHPLRGAKAS